MPTQSSPNWLVQVQDQSYAFGGGEIGKQTCLGKATGFLTRLPFHSLAAFVTFLAAPQTGWSQTEASDPHFHSGADPRITNQVNPGLLGGDSVFGASNGSGSMGSGQVAGPNITLTPKDFPFHQLGDPGN